MIDSIVEDPSVWVFVTSLVLALVTVIIGLSRQALQTSTGSKGLISLIAGAFGVAIWTTLLIGNQLPETSVRLSALFFALLLGLVGLWSQADVKSEATGILLGFINIWATFGIAALFTAAGLALIESDESLWLALPILLASLAVLLSLVYVGQLQVRNLRNPEAFRLM